MNKVETEEERASRRALEEAQRKHFIQERWARCWRTRWQCAERDDQGRPKRFIALRNAEMLKAAAGIPTVLPRGLFS